MGKHVEALPHLPSSMLQPGSSSQLLSESSHPGLGISPGAAVHPVVSTCCVPSLRRCGSSSQATIAVSNTEVLSAAKDESTRGEGRNMAMR
jgi:hypothetical protein